ncbi:MAG: hypothetical protein N2110_00560 [Flavobacteriales bacterium]|nr:hypothetical protein [Flavobacteriales bacterium]
MGTRGCFLLVSCLLLACIKPAEWRSSPVAHPTAWLDSLLRTDSAAGYRLIRVALSGTASDSSVLGPQHSWHAEFIPLWRWGLQLHAHPRLTYIRTRNSDGSYVQVWRLRPQRLPTLSSFEGQAILWCQPQGLAFSTRRETQDPLFRSLLMCKCSVPDSGRLRLICITHLIQGLSFRDSLPVLTLRHYVWVPP